MSQQQEKGELRGEPRDEMRDELRGGQRSGGIQVIARAGQIMRALGQNPQGLSLAAIAQEVKLPRSTVQRIVNALVEEMLLEQVGPAGGVRLGPAFGQLVSQTQTDIVSVTRAHLQKLSEHLQESVCLCSMAGERIYVIDRLVAERELRVVFPVGVYAPLYATSAGKVLLAGMPEEEVRRLLPRSLPVLASKTLGRAELLEQLEEARASGLAMDADEHIDGVASCAVLLDTYLGQFALCVVAPTARLVPELERARAALLQCKQEIERAIGQAPEKR